MSADSEVTARSPTLQLATRGPLFDCQAALWARLELGFPAKQFGRAILPARPSKETWKRAFIRPPLVGNGADNTQVRQAIQLMIGRSLVGTRTTLFGPGSSQFIVPAGVFRVFSCLWGAGGGGGGGSGAGYSGGWFDVTPGQVIAITGGASGTAGSPSTYGGNGGSSSFGTYLSATGGVGGGNYSASGAGSGAAVPGQGYGGTLNLAGASGGNGIYAPSTYGGGSGGAGYGFAPTVNSVGGAGNGGNGFGSGGGGGSSASPAGVNGGAGANGAVLVTY